MKCMYNIPPVYHSRSVYSILLWKTSLAAKEASMKSTNFHITEVFVFFPRQILWKNTSAEDGEYVQRFKRRMRGEKMTLESQSVQGRVKSSSISCQALVDTSLKKQEITASSKLCVWERSRWREELHLGLGLGFMAQSFVEQKNWNPHELLFSLTLSYVKLLGRRRSQRQH
jgi:hypothetical protein